jgi:hypothetical protein
VCFACVADKGRIDEDLRDEHYSVMMTCNKRRDFVGFARILSCHSSETQVNVHSNR